MTPCPWDPRLYMNKRFISPPTSKRPSAISVIAACLIGATAHAQQASPAPSSTQTQAPRPTSATRGVDYIVAVVGQELVTSGEIDRRLATVKEEAGARRSTLPPEPQLRQQLLESMIDERVVLVHARDSGVRIDEPELDRAVQSVALQNKLTMPQLREQLKKDGMDFSRFRSQLRDQIMVERVRERDVVSRIKVSDAEIDDIVAKQSAARGGSAGEFNVAQILVSVPDGADAATVARQRSKAETALQRVRARENFAAVARELSDDSNRAEGGEIGLRPASRLPDAFVAAVRTLNGGEVAPALLQTGAGFHVLKLIEKREAQGVTVTNTRARHILMRQTSQTSTEQIQRQMLEMKRQVETGVRKFEDLARQYSADESAAQGGDLGLVGADTFVPEFEAAMNALKPGQVSPPVVSRFGVHLIQVVERKEVQVDPKQLREQARNALREQRFEQAYADWVRDLRGRAYIEKREAP